MADERKYIDDVFTDGLRDYTEVPPPQAWSALEAKLDQRGGRRRLAWWWYVVVGITLVSTGFLYLRSRDQHKVIAKSPNKEIYNTTPVAAYQAPIVAEVSKAVPETQEEITDAVQEAPKAIPAGEPKQENVSTPVIASIPKQRTAASGENLEHDNKTKEQQPLAGTPKEVAVDKTSTVATDAVKSAPDRQDDTIQPIAVIQTSESLEDNIKRRTGVVMNIKVLPPIPAASTEDVAQEPFVAEADTLDAPQSENHGPLNKENLLVSAGNSNLPPVTQATPEVSKADSIVNAVAQSLSPETEALLASTQDAIAPTGPSIVEPVIFEQPKLGSNNFIGPMPDIASYAVAQWGAQVNDVPAPEDKPTYKANLEGSVKAGYEKGFGDYTVNKFVFAPMVQLNLSPKLSLVLQPTVKAGSVNNREIRDLKSYHAIQSSLVDSYKLYSTWSNAQGMIYDSVKAQYYYRQTYDSVTINSKVQAKTLFEIELPLLLNYQFGKRVSVYAGPTVNYSKIALLDADMKTCSGLVRADTLTYYTSQAASHKITGPEIGEVIQYNTEDFNKLEHPYTTNPTENKLRLGMMLGGTININNKLTVDILMQQNLSRMNYIPNSQVKSIYLQPYFRFMLGYKVFGNSRK